MSTAKSQADKGDGKIGPRRQPRARPSSEVKQALDKLKDEKDPTSRAKLTEDVKKFAEQKQDLGRRERALQGPQGRLPDRPAGC